jgi:hypothetical protein
MYPPNPVADGHEAVAPFDRERFDGFQRLWTRYGIPELVTLKNEIFAALTAGRCVAPRELLPPLDRAGRAVHRVALRQWRQIRPSAPD